MHIWRLLTLAWLVCPQLGLAGELVPSEKPRRELQLVVTIEDIGQQREFSLLLYRMGEDRRVQIASTPSEIQNLLLPRAEEILEQASWSDAQRQKLLAAAQLDIMHLWREYARLNQRIRTGHRPSAELLDAAHSLRIRINQPFSSQSLFGKIHRELLIAKCCVIE
ncbi:MAG: hypothetical protein NXI32_03145 [bacterium]|nr:hypothetical protein [bacterium]